MYIDWDTNVIHVLKTDMALIQATPAEVYELDLNAFRLGLKDIEDGEVGMSYPDTHKHNTEVLLSGITYARIVEVIDPYSVTFEDDQYTVVCTGANHNLADRKNPNQVSLIVNNAAGLITNPDIQYSSFSGGVHLDTNGSNDGTLYPTGTPRKPVNNMADAMLIAQYRGFGTIFVIGDATIGSSGDYSDMIFVGESHEKTTLTIDPSANVTRCEFYSCTVAGTLDGDCLLKDCMIGDLEYVNGEVKECILKPPGVITLGGTNHATLVRCVTECTLGGPPVTIDMGGAGQPLAIRDMSGAIKITNKTGPDHSSAIMAGGAIYLDLENMTGGTFKIAGVCDVYDWTTKDRISSGEYDGLTVVNNAISNTEVANTVWANDNGLAVLSDLAFIKGIEGGRWVMSGSEMIFYDDDNVTELARFDITYNAENVPVERTRT